MHAFTILALENAPADWRWQAMTSPFALVCLALMVVCVLGLLLLVRGMFRLGRATRQAGRPSLLRDRDGTAMIEFALVFPVLLFMILLLAQTTMAMGGNMFVHYAAFAATRAAIVQVPADYSLQGEGRNVVANGPKREYIRRAAVFALVPAAGRSQASSNLDVDGYVNGIARFYQAYNQPVPGWVTNGVLAGRLRYADANTTTSLMYATIFSPANMSLNAIADGETHTFGPKDHVAVKVTHKLDLSIPYIRALFADGRSADGMYRTIEAQYLLTNEGIDPSLPPTPPVPRQP